MNTMPPWLTRHLADTGKLDVDGVHRTARRARCPSCGAIILIGLDSEPLGLSARADPWPITPVSEVLALATGRGTYNLTRTFTPSGKRCWNIDRRYAEHISGHKKRIILAEHACHTPLPADQRIPASAAPPAANPGNEAPF